MNRSKHFAGFLLLALVALVVLVACDSKNSAPTLTPAPAPPPVKLGDPLPDLTTEERAAFERGKAMFVKRFKPSEGLGPFYNATSCESCHSDPVVGGSADLYRNFYLAVAGPSPTFQTKLSPQLPSPVLPAFGGDGSLLFKLDGRRMTLPATAGGFPVTSAQRNAPPIFGIGLFEFISNSTILANADPEDANMDGISGRTNADGAGMGRFGYKSQSNNIEFFTRAPLMNQLGVTTDPFRGSAGTISLSHGMAVQASATPNAPTRDNDGVTDPEMSAQDLGDLIAFSRFLAPPQPQPFDDAARRGEQQFAAIGCAKCHIPELSSSRGPVRAFTDLLIHDMGTELADGISFGSPQTSGSSPNHSAFEFRTQPLWGVSLTAPFLHDGRAGTLDEAIRAHGGEGAASRNAFVALSATDRDDLIAFLRLL